MPRKAMRTLSFACVLLAGASGACAQTEPAAALSAGITLDQWENLRGGVKRGSVALASAQLGLEIDAWNAFGWRGATLLVSGVYNDRSTISSEFVGDLHGVDNRDAAGGTRVLEAWVRQAFPRGYGKIGLIDLNSEFSVDRTGALFVNGAHGIGLEMEQLGWSGPSIYPRPRPAIVGAFETDATWKAGVFSGARAPDHGDRRRPGSDPVIVVLERSGSLGSDGRLTVGAWAHSASFGDTSAAGGRRAAAGGYLLYERPLWRGGERELNGFARFGVANPRAEPIASDLDLGLVLTQPLLRREGEAVGLAVLSAGNSRHVHLSAPDGLAQASRPETVIEATYRLPVGAGVSVQPDLQYVLHPGALDGRRDAVVIGVRFEGVWRPGL